MHGGGHACTRQPAGTLTTDSLEPGNDICRYVTTLTAAALQEGTELLLRVLPNPANLACWAKNPLSPQPERCLLQDVTSDIESPVLSHTCVF